MTNNYILIVDDNPRNIQLLAKVLTEADYKIEFALNGYEALEWIKNKTFNLVLLDIMMPEMNGYEVCQKMKEIPGTKEIPVIFLTALDSSESITKAFETGGVDYVSKPFNTHELLSRIKTHIDINLQRQKLAELNATKDKFFSIIAHDLKSPFSGLLGLSEYLIEYIENKHHDDAYKIAKTMNETLQLNYSLLENLLLWARSQTGKIEFYPELVNINEIARNIVSIIKINSDQKKIKLETAIEPDLNVVVDENMLSTILRNILNNAVKFTPENGHISLTIKKENSNIMFVVSDSGVGIPKNRLSSIFNIDKKVSTLGTNNEQGTGLGLMLCKEFVEKHNGAIGVESKENEGSSFWFTLP